MDDNTILDSAAETFTRETERPLDPVLVKVASAIESLSAVDESAEAAKISEHKEHVSQRWVACFLKAAEAYDSRNKS